MNIYFYNKRLYNLYANHLNWKLTKTIKFNLILSPIFNVNWCHLYLNIFLYQKLKVFQFSANLIFRNDSLN